MGAMVQYGIHVCIDNSSLNALRGIEIMSNMEFKSFKIHAWRGLRVPGAISRRPWDAVVNEKSI